MDSIIKTKWILSIIYSPLKMSSLSFFDTEQEANEYIKSLSSKSNGNNEVYYTIGEVSFQGGLEYSPIYRGAISEWKNLK